MTPANILIRYIPPPYILGGTCVVFGALVTGCGGASNYATVLALRILIGCAQSFILGSSIYGSLWFRRDELASVGGG
jgi:hypothetical protein